MARKNHLPHLPFEISWLGPVTTRKPHNAYVLSTPAAAGLPNEEAEAAGNGADKDHSREEKLQAYIKSLKNTITDEKKLFHNCMRESEEKSVRIQQLQQYITGLEEMHAQDKKLIEVRSIESARKDVRIGELHMDIERLLKNEKIHEWMHQDLLSQLRQAREAHEEQLAGWMEQVNALHKRIHMLERRSTGSTVMCPSLRR